MLEVSEAKVGVRDCCSSEDRDLIFVLHQVDCSCPPTASNKIPSTFPSCHHTSPKTFRPGAAMVLPDAC